MMRNLFLASTVLILFSCASKKQPVSTTATEETVPAYVPVPSPYQPSSTRVHDLLHTKLEVSFDWQKQYLHGVATLTLKPYFYPSNELVLDAKGFDIHSVKLVTQAGEKDLVYSYDSLDLNIELDATYDKNTVYTVKIAYTAKPNELKSGGSAAITEDKGLYFINPDGTEDKPKQIWTQGETEASSCWFPTIDSPNEKTTQEIYIRVDTTYLTVSNGLMLSSKDNGDGTRTDYWKQDKEHAPYLFMMAVGEFAVAKDSWRGKPVNYYVEKEYGPYAKGIFGNTPEMMEFFSNRLGVDYPWDKYSQIVVRDFVSGAMENTSAAIFMEGLHLTDRELLDKDWDYIIAHELFHHWFGDLVTCESWSNLPLNESFANYSEYLWFEHKYGKDRADYHAEDELQGYLRESRSKQVPLIRFNYSDKEDMFDAHSYNKGGRVLHMLRNYVGDDAFFASLQLFLETNQYKPVEIHQLRLAFEEVTGQDWNWFFNQWFLSAGHPVLSVTKQYDNGVLTVSVQQNQNVKYSPVFRLPTKLSVWVDGQQTIYPIVVDSVTNTFEIELAASPELVLFDPDQVILGEVSQSQNVAEYIVQYQNEKNYLSRYNAVLGISSNPYENQELAYNPILDSTAYYNTLLAALEDPFWNVRSMALTALSRYNGENVNALRNKVELMASNDAKTQVRAQAIKFLSGQENAEDYLQVYLKGVEDSSYVVNAASLLAYLTTEKDSVKLEKAIEANMKEDNGEVTKALAKYFVQVNDSTKLDWFISSYDRLTKGDKIRYAETFSSYYKLVDEEGRKQMREKLHDTGLNGASIYDRFSGYLGLYLLFEDEQTRSLRLELVEKETNPTLVNAYARREDALPKQ